MAVLLQTQRVYLEREQVRNGETAAAQWSAKRSDAAQLVWLHQHCASLASLDLLHDAHKGVQDSCC